MPEWLFQFSLRSDQAEKRKKSQHATWGAPTMSATIKSKCFRKLLDISLYKRRNYKIRSEGG
mgnify:CR=1 FL=1